VKRDRDRINAIALDAAFVACVLLLVIAFALSLTR